MDQHGQLVLLPLHDLSRVTRAKRVSRARHTPDEKVVAHALPKIEIALQVTEQQLAHGKNYLVGTELTLADFYLLPCTYSFSFAPEANSVYLRFHAFNAWRERMEALPAVKKLRASLPPRAPFAQAREWAISHRPKY
jgi:glutathione S-transferase